MPVLCKKSFGAVDSIRQNCLIGIAVVNDPGLDGPRKTGSFCGNNRNPVMSRYVNAKIHRPMSSQIHPLSIIVYSCAG